jgi:hypothetical protein
MKGQKNSMTGEYESHLGDNMVKEIQRLNIKIEKIWKEIKKK